MQYKENFLNYTYIGKKILNVKQHEENEKYKENFKKETYINLESNENKKIINDKKNLEINKNNSMKDNISKNTSKINGIQDMLVIEIFVRIRLSEIDNQYFMEILFNDLTKKDLFFGIQQYIISSCQFLHDFKNPLFCINQEISELKIFFKKYLKKNDLIDKKEKINFITKFKFIREMSQFCQTMILAYENYSKLLYKPKNFNLDLKSFNLHKFLNFFKSIMDIKINKSNKNVEFSIINSTKKDYLIFTDQNKLKQIMINLLTNSEKFTIRGKIELIVQDVILNNKNYIYSI